MAEYAPIAIIGGSGFYEFSGLEHVEELRINTPYGDVFCITQGSLEGVPLVFIPRHGIGHRLPPHKVNYRANVWALKSLKVRTVISINAVGGIHPTMFPGKIVIPNQIIDYTYGREHSFADLLDEEINHIDFTYPFCSAVQKILADQLAVSEYDWHFGGVYACTQGPRLETAAEIDRLERDGNDLVGMTLMPECALAREAGLDYVSVCAVVNWAAGRSQDAITLAQIREVMRDTSSKIEKLLKDAIGAIAALGHS